MRHTVRWGFVLTLLALFSPYRAHALELGNIKLNSYLNQPLNAQISVQAVHRDELDQAHIGIASRNVFEKAGIERRTLPGLVRFKLVKGNDGTTVIKLTSQDPIKEPLLDFILEVSWPKGRLMREYTVLLDPPAASPEAVPATETPIPGPSGEQAMGGQAAPQETPLSTAPSPAIPTRSIEPKLTDDSYGPTMRPNTLWAIVKAAHLDSSGSIEQAMLAVVKKNPDAFYDNNVNELKAGYVLGIPGKDLIQQVGEADAVQAVKLQNRRWLQSKKGRLPPVAAPRKSRPGGGRADVLPGSPATDTDTDAAQGDRVSSRPEEDPNKHAGGGLS